MEKDYFKRKKELLQKNQKLEKELMYLYKKASPEIGETTTLQEYNALWKKNYDWNRYYELLDQMYDIKHEVFKIRWEEYFEKPDVKEKMEKARANYCDHTPNGPKEIVTGHVRPMLFAACKDCGRRYQREWTPEDIKRYRSKE